LGIFADEPGTDFDELFAPVVRYDSLRLLIAISVSLGWAIPDQLDIKGAFLYGYLNEEIYMRLPPGYEQPGCCARLKRSIYGLKQSPRQWYERLTGFLIPLGYRPMNFDPCVMIHSSLQIIIAIYVDDISIFGADPGRNELKEALKKEFNLSELGPLNWLLGIQIEWHQNSVTLSQQAYVDQLLVKFGMDTCNPVLLPLNPNQKLVKAEEGADLADVSLYQQIIGSLMYLVIGTRPDLAFTVSALSQFASKPTKTHMGALKQVLRYLKGTRSLKLTYRRSNGGLQHNAAGSHNAAGLHNAAASHNAAGLHNAAGSHNAAGLHNATGLHNAAGNNSSLIDLAGYSDADYAGDRSDRKSTSGYIFQLASNTICWRAVKQRCTATSTVEAEYIALSTAAKHHMWLQHALVELRLLHVPSALSTDNDGTIDLTLNPRISDRSKHIDVAYHHVRDLAETGKLTVLYVTSHDNLADICTKPLPGPRLSFLRNSVLGTADACSHC
jgi:hypothetical protein